MKASLSVVFSCFVLSCTAYNTQPLQCGKNQISACVKDCPPETTCRTRGIEYDCADDGKKCEQKCVCKEGYYRNPLGDCISEAECDKCPGDHEYFACSGACDNVCSKLDIENKTNCLEVNKQCNSMCYCDDGYARDYKNNCVPIEECPKKKPLECGDNEESSCVKDYPPETTCRTRGIAYSCKKDGKGCEHKCVCKEGYYRNPLGDCISEADCDKCQGDHEYFACSGACDNVCSKLDIENKTNCLEVNKQCNSMCYCDDGYARDYKNNCVPIEECPKKKPLQCGKNQISAYVKDCPPETTCRTRGIVYDCADDGKKCEQKCVCKEGYYRNPLGDCISEAECDKCPGDHEYFACSGACDNVCSKLDIENKTNCLEVNKQCNSMCYCDDGYARDYKNNCVPIEECPKKKPLECGDNEESSCVKDCPPETTCRTRGIAYSCKKDGKGCEHKCVCKEGYYRNPLGDCISEADCDKCQGDHEYFACSGACDNVCSKLDIENKTNCLEVNKQCNSMCYCDDGYARDYKNNCVPIEECPKKKPLQCGKNQISACVKDCPPETTCRTRGIEYDCADDGKKCEQKCVCKEGYYRNPLGDCISEAECDKCPGDHEYFACSGACDNVCSKLDIENKTNCLEVNKQCNSMCYCDDGYARDYKNNCVPIEKCPKKINKCSDPNEEYKECKKTCPPDTCLSLVAKFKCPAKPSCEPGCNCKPGFLRQKKKSPCIPICECKEMAKTSYCQKS